MSSLTAVQTDDHQESAPPITEAYASTKVLMHSLSGAEPAFIYFILSLSRTPRFVIRAAFLGWPHLSGGYTESDGS